MENIITEKFLEKYKDKLPNWGFNGLGYIVFKRTYCRPKRDGSYEEWYETVARCINGAQKIGADYSVEEAERLYDYIFNFKCNFAGRMLWQLGTSTIERFHANAALNCLSGETEVLTRQGWKQIKDLENQRVEIVTEMGKWIKAPFKSYGKQKLLKIVFQDKYTNEIIVYATSSHRWITMDENHVRSEILTKDLKVNNKVPLVRGKNSSNITDFLSPQGIQHGLVFGDGSCNGQESFIDLIDNTYDHCHKYFLLNRIGWKNPANIRHIRYNGMPNYFKQLPNINENKIYLSGFLAGWIAADGSVNKANGSIRLFNANKENLMKARDIAAILGYRTSKPVLMRDYNPFDPKDKSSELWSITFRLYDNPHKLIIRKDHKKKLKSFNEQYNNWAKVVSVEETERFEKVYCAEVPNTHSFVIEGNILTGNCWFTTVTSIDDFCFIFENLMLGGGVGFSVRREDIHELPKVQVGIKVYHCNTKDADFIVPDSREGWVNLLKKVLKAYFISGKSFSYSTILVRNYGEPIKGFGGTASGSKILVDGIENICKVLESREGKKLRSIDVLDVCNIIGSIVVAGNLRRCLPKESKIHTKFGIKNIEDILCGDLVLTSSGEYVKVINKFEQGIQKTIIITTDNGELECTPKHKVAVLNSIHNYEWKIAENLKKDDLLINPLIPIEGAITMLPKWDYIKVNHSTTCQDIIIPSLDEDIAWFIGIFHGNGYTKANYKENGFNAYVSLVFALNKYKIAEKAKKCLEKFGLNNVTLKKRKNENSYIVSCVSKQIAWYLDKFIKRPKTEIIIPDFIWKAKQNIKLAYISGLIDSDGSVNSRPFRLLTTIYRNFAFDVQKLLYSCGIPSFIYEGNKRANSWNKLWHINIKSINFLKDIRNIKTLELNNFPIKNYTRFGARFSSDMIKKDKSIPNKIFRKLGGYNNKYISADKLNILTGNNFKFFPSKVLSIKEGRKIETYDIEVENKHEFYCNGYLVHNSAMIALGDPDDYLYIRAKRWDLGNIPNWRAMSNNTIYCDDFSHISNDIWEGYQGNGEPYGLFNIKLSQKTGRIGDTIKDNCEGQNPCFTGDTLIETIQGKIAIKDLVNKEIEVYCYDNNGKITTSLMKNIRKTGEKQFLLEIKLNNNAKLYCTLNHKFMIKDGSYKEARDLTTDDELMGSNLLINNIKVISHKMAGFKADVFNGEVEKYHNFALGAGIIVRNCGEINLAKKECCCLSELYLNNITSLAELIDCAKLLYKTQKAICAMSFLHPETEKIVHKNFRIGISVTGICQSLHKLEWLDKTYKEIRKYDREWSKKKGYPESIKISTVKPSGTISLLAGATPGIHPAFSEYYIRRIRMASNDKLIDICKELGYKVEYVKNFDGSEDYNTVVVEFPCFAGENVIVAKDMTAIRQLELVKQLQTIWSDNSVSVTIYYKKEELDSIKKWLKDNYKDYIKSISFVLHKEHGFEQAPYEEITKEQYEELIKKVKPLHNLKIENDVINNTIDVEECKGACPIK